MCSSIFIGRISSYLIISLGLPERNAAIIGFTSLRLSAALSFIISAVIFSVPSQIAFNCEIAYNFTAKSIIPCVSSYRTFLISSVSGLFSLVHWYFHIVPSIISQDSSFLRCSHIKSPCPLPRRACLNSLCKIGSAFDVPIKTTGTPIVFTSVTKKFSIFSEPPLLAWLKCCISSITNNPNP